MPHRVSRDRSGDRGITSLPRQGVVSKAAMVVAAMGDVDELSAVLGTAASVAPRALQREIESLQRDLFEVGADLAQAKGTPMLATRRVRALERKMAAAQAGLPPLRHFVLPGGAPLAAILHAARAVCRRAERSAATARESAPFNPIIPAYLNRLSDYLFVMARAVNARAHAAEKPWPAPTR